MDIYCLVFDDYETLDLMGPVEFLARVPNVKLHYVSQVGGLIRSKQGFYIETEIAMVPLKRMALCRTIETVLRSVPSLTVRMSFPPILIEPC